MTVDELVVVFIQEKRLQFSGGLCKAKTLDRFARRLPSFASYVGVNADANSFSQHHLTGWIFSHPEWASSHTKSDAAGALVTCFQWAVRHRLISHCPFTRPRGLWPALRPRIAIRPDEYKAVMLAAKRRGYRRARFCFRIGLFFLWQTGARTGEMRSVGWEDVDFETGIATLTEHKTLHVSGEARLIALTPVVIRMLRWLHRVNRHPQRGPIFTNSVGKPWDCALFARYFRKVALSAGVRVKLSPYCLRHGFTVQALETGATERQIADLLGQATTRYVSWYGRSTRQRGDYLRNVLQKIHRKRPAMDR